MKKNLNKSKVVILFSIFLLAFLLRIIGLGEVPRGLQSDEASFLINSASIMKTGMDEDGKAYPIFLDSLIDSKPALYSYLQIPFLLLFGINTFSSRIPSILLGVFSIYFFYILIKKATKDEKLALLGAFFLSISPWHIVNSRATQEVILSFLLILINMVVYYEIISKKSTQKIQYVFFFVTSILAMYSYHSAKIFLPLFFFLLLITQLISKSSSRNTKKTLISLSITILAFALTAYAALTRFSAIGIFHNDLPKAMIFEFTTQATGATPLALIRFFYNKPVFYFKFFLEQYLAHFDLNFLFNMGGATMRFLVPHHGVLYIFDLLLMPFGLYHLITNKKFNKYLVPWFIFLILAPLPAALTIEEIPSSIRSFYLIIPLMILSVMGVDFLLKNIKNFFKSVLILMLSLVVVWSLGFFSQQFFVSMSRWKPRHRSRIYEKSAQLVAENEGKYDSIVVTNDLREMYIYLWLNDVITIDQIQSQPRARYEDQYSIDKYSFTQEKCDTSFAEGKVMIISPQSCNDELRTNFNHKFDVNYDDGSPGFIIFTNEADS